MEILVPEVGAGKSDIFSPVSHVGAALFSRLSLSIALCFSTSARVGWGSWGLNSAGGSAVTFKGIGVIGGDEGIKGVGEGRGVEGLDMEELLLRRALEWARL